MKHLASGATSATVLAAALGLSAAGGPPAAASPAQYDGGPALTLLSPTPHAAFQGTRPVEVSAMYQGTADNGIVAVELYVDGVHVQTKNLDAPETRGIVSFLIDASLLKSGDHKVVVRCVAQDQEVRSVKGAFTFHDGDAVSAEAPASGQTLETPRLRVLTPRAGEQVQGTVTVKVEGNDVQGRTPYVSISIDGQFKTLVNYRPFEYEWDTTTVPNGPHEISIAESFDTDGLPTAHPRPIRVVVNNPGGETQIRHDLTDTVPPAPVKAAPAKRLTRKAALKPAAAKPVAVKAAAKPPAIKPLTLKPVQMARAMHSLSERLHLDLKAGLSDPFLPAAPLAVQAAPAPVRFKPMPRVNAPLNLSAATSAFSRAAETLRAARPAPAPARMAKADLAAESAHPFLAIPHLHVPLPKIQAVTPALPAAEARPHRLVVPMPTLRLHLPQANLPTLPRAARVHMTHAPIPARLHADLLLKTLGQTTVLFNEKVMSLDRPLTARQNVVFGPLRQVFERGGGALQWNARQGTVRARRTDKHFALTIGSRQATVNARPFRLDSAPFLSAGRTMVPVSFLGAALDADVQYDPATGHLKITSRK